MPDAVSAFDALLAISPQYTAAIYEKGIALLYLSRFQEACQTFDEALDLNPSLADAWLYKGIALVSLDQSEEAIAAFDKVAGPEPPADRGCGQERNCPHQP